MLLKLPEKGKWRGRYCGLPGIQRTHGKGSVLYQGRLALDIGKHFFTESVIKHCNSLPREVVNAPRMSGFKRHLDNAVNKVL